MNRDSLKKFMNLSTLVLETLWGDIVEIGGIEMTAAVSRSSWGGSMGLGGDVPDGTLVVRVRKSECATEPIHGKTVVKHKGKRWRVDELIHRATEDAYTLRCVPADE